MKEQRGWLRGEDYFAFLLMALAAGGIIAGLTWWKVLVLFFFCVEIYAILPAARSKNPLPDEITTEEARKRITSFVYAAVFHGIFCIVVLAYIAGSWNDPRTSISELSIDIFLSVFSAALTIYFHRLRKLWQRRARI